HRATPGRVERGEIAERLSELQRPKREHLSRNRQIPMRGRRQQHEHAGIRSPLVELTGRVQIPRTVPEQGGRMRALSNAETKCVQLIRKLLIRSDVGEERDRKSTRLNSSHEWISYAVFCLKKKK